MPLPIGHYSRGGTFAEGVAYAERMHGITKCEEPDPEPEPEPTNEEPAALMAVRTWGDDKEFWFKPLMKDLPVGEYELYTRPQWQGLTDEERDEVSKDYGPLSGGEWTLMLLVEQALKEKNGER
jgi:hypothetical protein